MENFHTPLSSQAYLQFMELQTTTQNVQLSGTYDKWIYPWASDFSSIKMYKLLKQGVPAPPIFAKIWKNASMLKYKIFFWLLMHDRVNSRNLLHRKSFHLPSYNCALCHAHTEETSHHLFWDCDFALSCWDSIITNINRGTSLYDEIIIFAQALPAPIAMEILIMDVGTFGYKEMGEFLEHNHIQFNHGEDY